MLCCLPVNYTKDPSVVDDQQILDMTIGRLMKVGILSPLPAVFKTRTAKFQPGLLILEVLKISHFSQLNLKLCSKGVL